jgi:hypothetical protein
MRRLFHAALALMTCLALPSCSLIGAGVRAFRSKKKPEAARDDNTVHMIGVVELVNPEQRFVLIRTHGKLSIAAGQEITAMDAGGTTTKLKVSPEKKQDFLIADIVDGNPRAGNLVVFKPVKAAAPPASPSQPVGPGPPPVLPPFEPPLPLTPPAPVTVGEFTKPGSAVPSPSPIPPQPVPSANPDATIPVPGQIQLPPVVR